MDSDGCPEQYPVPAKAAAKDSEGSNEPDILPAEVGDDSHESSQLKKENTELVRSIKTPSSATLLALPPLPGEDEVYEELDEAEMSTSGEPLQQPCCRKPPRFWCLLTVVLSTIIAIVLVGVLTRMYTYNTESVSFISRPSLVVPSVSIDVIILNYCFNVAPMLRPYYFLELA